MNSMKLRTILAEEGLEDACWEGYEAFGMKEKGGRKVPNCVPVKKKSSSWPRTARVEFHVEYVNNRTLRLMVSDRSSSTYFEARVGPNASRELSELAAQAGFRISPEIIEEEIEQK